MDQPDSLRKRTSFWVRSRGLMARRMLVGRYVAPSHRMHRAASPTRYSTILAVDRSPLYTVTDPRERVLELGKIQNLRIAAAMLDGLLLPADRTFSFWRQVGRPSAAKGYVTGRELRNGCLIPSVAGGLCQLSNALSRTASRAGFTIDERHRHSASVDDLQFDPATDATLFWNYVDLRLTAHRDSLLRVQLEQDHLVVSVQIAP